jgi:hypothetical protein
MTALAGPEAASLRRRLGPVAWCALECLLDASVDGITSASTIRSVAVDLGVAKNTAHRAVARLVAAGLVEPVQERAQDGRFRHGRYRLHVTGVGVLPPPRPARPRVARPTAAPEQLSLLPD